MFLLLGAGFGIAALSLFIEATAWIMKKLKRKFFPEKECYQNSTDLEKHGHTEYENKNNEQQGLVHDDTDQVGFRKRCVFSANARFKTCEDSDEKSDRLQYSIPLQSMTSLPATSSPKLNRRIQTPRPCYTFTVERDAEMFGDEIQEALSYTEYGKCEEASSMRSEFQKEKAAEAEDQEQSYHMYEEDASGPLAVTGGMDQYNEQNQTEQDKDMAHDNNMKLLHL
jgi:hypothetical protein